MYDWEDKDGYGKLVKILKRLVENGYNAKMLGSKMFVRLYDPNGEYVCDAYSSSWHSLGLIFIQHWCQEIETTFSPDKA